MARNPATGAPVRIKKTAVPKFRPGAGFKEVVSGAKKLAPPAKAPAKAATKAAPAKAAAKAPAKATARTTATRTATKAAPAKAARSLAT
jgi:DNA-binding protein HU-beta